MRGMMRCGGMKPKGSAMFVSGLKLPVFSQNEGSSRLFMGEKLPKVTRYPLSEFEMEVR